jgi:hypothetical protein
MDRRFHTSCDMPGLLTPLRISALVRSMLVIACVAVPLRVSATTAPSSAAPQKKMLYRGTLPQQLGALPNGEHSFKIRLYSKDGALVHEEELTARVQNGSYDIVLGSAAPLFVDVQDLALAISVNGSKEVRCCTNIVGAAELGEHRIDEALMNERPLHPIIPEEVNARAVERWAIANGFLNSAPEAVLPAIIHHAPNHMSGVKMEMAFAMPHDENVVGYYEAGKYGRINIEYNNMFRWKGNNFGLVGQAMHVAHHMLFYSGGVSTDVNGDGMFLFTLGAAHYRVGNRRTEPFVDAPFMRVKFHSSPDRVFLYSEVETTMHIRSMMTGTFGLGVRMSNAVKLIGGLHHTEFWMPTERMNRVVRGFHGIFSYGI